MDNLFSNYIIPGIKILKITNERQDIIRQFQEELNRERWGTKWKPLTGRAVAIKLGLLKTNQELYQFFSECKDYKNRHGSFGKRFFGGGKLDNKKHLL